MEINSSPRPPRAASWHPAKATAHAPHDDVGVTRQIGRTRPTAYDGSPNPTAHDGPPRPSGRQCVATAHPLATEAACAMFRAGGNAVDAAVAAAWALAVCEPGNSGLGGQTILLLRRGAVTPSEFSATAELVLDGHSRAPAAVSQNAVDARQQHSGHRATTVPTTALVLEVARQRFGRLSLAAVIEPAITLAVEGFPVTKLHRRQLVWCLNSLRSSLSANRLLLDDGRPYAVGQLFRQPALASTLQRISQHGVEDFYHGQIARQIADDMSRHGGLLTQDDLASVDPPAWRQPISTSYRGHTIVTAGPPAGGTQVVAGLEMLQQHDLGGPEPGPWYEALGEATYHAFRQREDLARCDDEPGETTHLCTADAEGNIVSLTQSIQSLFGARAACQPCGFVYNNYLTTCPRHPHPQQLSPRCQPRSNAAPTLVFQGDTVQLALGGAGSRRTTSAILHTISGVLDRRLTLAEAVDAPRFHVKLSRKAWLERGSQTEPLWPRLAQRFRLVQFRSRYSYAMGCVQAIAFLPCGSLKGSSDPRREGTAQTI